MASVGAIPRTGTQTSGLSVTKIGSDKTFAMSLATHQESDRRLGGNAIGVQSLFVDPSWPSLRITLANFLHGAPVEIFMVLVILFNMVVLVIETDARVGEGEPDTWVKVISMLLLAVYAIESSLRIFVYRLAYFTHPWSLLDFCIVVVAVAFEPFGSAANLPSISVLRIFRLIPVIGSSKSPFVGSTDLHLMMRGFLNAMGSIMWATVVLCILITSWSVLAVQILHPLNEKLTQRGEYQGSCDRCPRAFESVSQASLTFFQALVAGDSWGSTAIPLIENYPATIIIFLGVFISVTFGLMNLIMAVIVDRAQLAREQSDHDLALEKDKAFLAASKTLLELCKDLDTDSSGTLTQQELLEGYDQNKFFFETLKLMDISKDDMTTVFHIMDEGGHGEINYEVFVEQLHKMKSHDVRTLLVFIKFYVAEIRKALSGQLEKSATDIMSKLDEARSDTIGLQRTLTTFTLNSKATALNSKTSESINYAEFARIAESLEEHTTLERKRKLSYGTESSSLSPKDKPSNRSRAQDGEISTAIERLSNLSEELIGVLKGVATESQTHTKLLSSLGEKLSLPLSGARTPRDMNHAGRTQIGNEQSQEASSFTLWGTQRTPMCCAPTQIAPNVSLRR